LKLHYTRDERTRVGSASGGSWRAVLGAWAIESRGLRCSGAVGILAQSGPAGFRGGARGSQLGVDWLGVAAWHLAARVRERTGEREERNRGREREGQGTAAAWRQGAGAALKLLATARIRVARERVAAGPYMGLMGRLV
jgi:hypothetical protein